MLRRAWLLPVALLILLGALYGFRLGWIAARLTETDAIEAYAARYLAQAGPGARMSDCAAFPGERVWLVLRCGSPGAYRAYWINRFGGLTREAGPAPWSELVPASRAPST